MAKAYSAYSAKHDLSSEAKKDAYRVVLLRSMASEEDVLQKLKLKKLSKEDAREIMKGF